MKGCMQTAVAYFRDNILELARSLLGELNVRAVVNDLTDSVEAILAAIWNLNTFTFNLPRTQ